MDRTDSHRGGKETAAFGAVQLPGAATPNIPELQQRGDRTGTA